MKVSGFSICRNAVKFDYPIVEAIQSALPVVDEFVVNVGQSDDGTLEIIRSIGSEKIRIVETVWDDSMKKDGLLFSHETNKALARCSGDWALYLQADEVLHERDYDVLCKNLRDQVSNPSICIFMVIISPAILGFIIVRCGSFETTNKSNRAAMRSAFGSRRIRGICRACIVTAFNHRERRCIITGG
jgi:glycosyltransferase involved in cell wall biosynthesis